MANRPLLLGHRGARSEKSVAENTLPAFDLALAHGCDGFEFDVQRSADGEAVICHDATSRGLEIAQASAQRLALPHLRDVLARYQSRAFLDIELKVSGLEEVVIDLLRKHAPIRGCVVSSFLPEVLQAIHGIDSTIPLGLICETRAQLSLWPELPVKYVILHFTLLRPDSISEITAAGRKVFVWTVNRPEAMRQSAAQSVDGIISDDTKRLASTLG
jgi:glycerophosphoryl diester phosphodiesterase